MTNLKNIKKSKPWHKSNPGHMDEQPPVLFVGLIELNSYDILHYILKQ